MVSLAAKQQPAAALKSLHVALGTGRDVDVEFLVHSLRLLGSSAATTTATTGTAAASGGSGGSSALPTVAASKEGEVSDSSVSRSLWAVGDPVMDL